MISNLSTMAVLNTVQLLTSLNIIVIVFNDR